MTDKQLKKKLNKFDYTTLWLDYSVLTIDFLVDQELAFDNSDDKNTEHYRYQTFRYYLSSKDKLSDGEFLNYLKLTFEDSNFLMAGAAAVDLFNNVELTDSQFDKLCKAIGHFGEWTEKIVARQTFLRQLKTSKLTPELFQECIVNGDSFIHEYILEIADINQLKELTINGKNKKIRDIATGKVNSLK